MPYVRGFLHVRESGRPDNELPEGPNAPVDPGFGGGIAAPIDPGFDLPLPPPGMWPPPSSTLPIVPAPPGTPPGAIWPPIGNPPVWSGGVVPPVRPGHDLPVAPGHPGGGPMPGGERPDAGLPTPPPGIVGQPPAHQTYWVVVGIPGVGWRYAALDPSLQPAPPIAGTPAPKG